MARGRRERTDKRRGAVLGWVLIALLLAALAAGGFAVYRAAAYWRNKVIQNAAALTVPAAACAAFAASLASCACAIVEDTSAPCSSSSERTSCHVLSF